MPKSILTKILEIETVIKGNKWARLKYSPFKYCQAIFHRECIYRITKSARRASAKLVWGDDLDVLLPSGVDMFILGIKADDSEVRLTKYLIKVLMPGDQFIDIGAHFGYYSLLAANRTGPSGAVLAVEPSNDAFSLLTHNVKSYRNIRTNNSLLGSNKSLVPFYEFPAKYAEYNSTNIKQYQNQSWFREDFIRESQKETVRLDSLVKTENGKNTFIKIDVEGSEYEVLLGASKVIERDRPRISMEFVGTHRSNSAHQNAVRLLREWGYQSFVIDRSGDLEHVKDLVKSLKQRKLESDNIVFSHS